MTTTPDGLALVEVINEAISILSAGRNAGAAYLLDADQVEVEHCVEGLERELSGIEAMYALWLTTVGQIAELAAALVEFDRLLDLTGHGSRDRKLLEVKLLEVLGAARRVAS